ncbi:MAG: bifunctional 4-hydroxy-2-oxoglutarate aldolase/2-dehydro-3-deoxy-phosphogluconate aldolase [Acidobacteria bacterium]|nr:bifunctional 4-hydroxy-2-oxoglutarate aldolase/2-dehydro-3-deoxy-phosphogluconate aldolase [Acidobacteriota bacterium]
MNNSTFHRIEASRVIAILRGNLRGHERVLADALHAGGLTALEVTLNSPDAFGVIERLLHHAGDRMAIGAGTVLQPDEVERVAAIGGQFIVSPNRDVRVIARTKELGLLSFPGCYTPSEVVEATQAGADAVKLFPATMLGVNYVKALRGPLPDIRYVPTGGVTPELAREYVLAGAWAVGVGSELIAREFFQAADVSNALSKIQARAAAYREALIA